MSKNVYKNTKYRSRCFKSAGIFFLCLMIMSGCTRKDSVLIPQADDTASITAAAGTTAASSVTVSEETVPEQIYVHVCGAVLREGLYCLAFGARVSEAIEAAGGFLPEADTTYLNLAAVLSDGMQLLVPRLVTGDEVAEATGSAQEGGISHALIPTGEVSAGSAARININTATAAELSTLNGIGPAKAEDIIAYREAHGLFSSTEELLNVSGIGDKIFNKIKNCITV